MRIRLIVDEKIKNAQLRDLEADYRARIAHFADLVVEEFGRGLGVRRKSAGALADAEHRLLKRLNGSTKVCLDARGKEWTSEEFAKWLNLQALSGKRELAFLVGGPEGLSPALKRKADLMLALSRMTLTHEWARVLLLEQIYRGFQILAGHPYAK